jgi:F1F0 ATPase subunit 2
MNEFAMLLLSFVAGLFLGVIFFGGLWLTVRRGLQSNNPALWFAASLLLRTTLIVVTFLFVAQGHWSRLLACVLGFLISRLMVVRRLTSDRGEQISCEPKEAEVANQS